MATPSMSRTWPRADEPESECSRSGCKKHGRNSIRCGHGYLPIQPVILAAVVVRNLVITVPCIWGSAAPRAKLLPITFAWVVYVGREPT